MTKTAKGKRLRVDAPAARVAARVELRVAALDDLVQELARIGLLLQHDVALPSATALLVGAPLRGSWWGHPRAHDIFVHLEAFETGAGALTSKLVAGKQTYIDRRLWPPFLRLVEANAEAAPKLSPLARRLLEQVLHDGAVLLDTAALGVPSRELLSARRELETGLLVHADSVHQPSGAHAKILESWQTWGKRMAVRPGTMPLEEAKAALREALERLAAGAGRSVKVGLDL
jgi:hypothetical protein